MEDLVWLESRKRCRTKSYTIDIVLEDSTRAKTLPPPPPPTTTTIITTPITMATMYTLLALLEPRLIY